MVVALERKLLGKPSNIRLENPTKLKLAGDPIIIAFRGDVYTPSERKEMGRAWKYQVTFSVVLQEEVCRLYYRGPGVWKIVPWANHPPEVAQKAAQKAAPSPGGGKKSKSPARVKRVGLFSYLNLESNIQADN